MPIYQLIQHNMPENVYLHQYCCKPQLTIKKDYMCYNYNIQ